MYLQGILRATHKWFTSVATRWDHGKLSDLGSSGGSIGACLSCRGTSCILRVKFPSVLRPFLPSPPLCLPCSPTPITQKFRGPLSILLTHPRGIPSPPALSPLSNLWSRTGLVCGFLVRLQLRTLWTDPVGIPLFLREP